MRKKKLHKKVYIFVVSHWFPPVIVPSSCNKENIKQNTNNRNQVSILQILYPYPSRLFLPPQPLSPSRRDSLHSRLCSKNECFVYFIFSIRNDLIKLFFRVSPISTRLFVI